MMTKKEQREKIVTENNIYWMLKSSSAEGCEEDWWDSYFKLGEF